MKKLIACVTLAALAGLFANPVKAAPVSVTLTIQPAQSVISATIAALGTLTATVSTTLTGTQNITLTPGEMLVASGNVVTSENADFIAFNGGTIGITDASLFVDLNPLGGVNAGFSGASLNGLNSTGNIPLNIVSDGFSFNGYTLDPGDNFGGNVTSTSLNSGLLTYAGTGTIGGLLGSGTLDFNAEPLSLDLPPLGDVASLSQTQTFLGASTIGLMICSTYNVDVLLSAPLSISQNVITDPVAVAATLQGQIVAQGSYLYTVCVPIPEPSSFVLMGIAVLGLVPLARRLRRKA